MPTKSQIARAARSVRLAEQCVRKVLKLDHEHEQLLPIERIAELEATCVILMRSQKHLWSQFEKGSNEPKSQP